MSEETEKYKKAWEKFQAKMASLKKRRFEIIKNISKDLDEQEIKALKEKLK
ncbi:MAG: hypothetical protein NTY33_00610 [Candidatus Moranbacteria bacterium]|nr:hypothetical protein [Candidatus Moranbacteria bacterium]